jgi:hypothetical protein
MTLAHKGSNGMAKNTPPDVCKTPSPGGPVPIPYPVIISMASDLKEGTTTVKADGNMAAVKGSELSKCSGDEAGTAGGVVSSTNMKEAKWLLYSFDVKLDGKNACRLSDKMTMNHANTVCLAGFTQAPLNITEKDIKCAIKKCDKKPYDIEKTAEGADVQQKDACAVLGTKKHACVQKELEKKKAPEGTKGTGVAEQTFSMNTLPPSPATASPGPGNGRRIDAVIGDPDAVPRKLDLYDAKFPCPDSVKGGKRKGRMASRKVTGNKYMGRKLRWRKARATRLDYKMIAGQGSLTYLSPTDCQSEKCD